MVVSLSFVLNRVILYVPDWSSMTLYHKDIIIKLWSTVAWSNKMLLRKYSRNKLETRCLWFCYLLQHYIITIGLGTYSGHLESETTESGFWGMVHKLDEEWVSDLENQEMLEW